MHVHQKADWLTGIWLVVDFIVNADHCNVHDACMSLAQSELPNVGVRHMCMLLSCSEQSSTVANCKHMPGAQGLALPVGAAAYIRPTL